jgi:hypothetical protein
VRRTRRCLGGGLFLTLLALAGCGPTVIVRQRALEDSSPQSVAVLPFTVTFEAEGERARVKVAAVRGILQRRLASLPYLHLDNDQVDRRLRRAGLSETEAMKRAGEGRLHDVLPVDAYLLGELTSLSNIQGILLYRQAIGGVLRLVDARTGIELASIEHTESDVGGFLLAFSQSLEAIQNTLDNSSDIGFVRLAERFAESVVRSIPPPPRPADPAQPASPSAKVTASREGVLGVGDTVSIEASADPGLEAHLVLGHERVLPLAEEEPGIYRGQYRVVLGDSLDEAMTVHVEDAFGVGASRVLRDRLVRISARPPAAPDSLTATPKAEQFTLNWSPCERAIRYRVYGVSKNGIPSLLADVEVPTAHVAVGQPRYAVAGLDAQGNLGPLAIVDAPQDDTGGMSRGK